MTVMPPDSVEGSLQPAVDPLTETKTYLVIMLMVVCISQRLAIPCLFSSRNIGSHLDVYYRRNKHAEMQITDYRVLHNSLTPDLLSIHTTI
jgi:hypothetical protein